VIGSGHPSCVVEPVLQVEQMADFTRRAAGDREDINGRQTGGLGFSFTIPHDGFVADATWPIDGSTSHPTPYRPFPKCFPGIAEKKCKENKQDSYWEVEFKQPRQISCDTKKPGDRQCEYSQIPGSKNCSLQ
jgi:hypothetical protein